MVPEPRTVVLASVLREVELKVENLELEIVAWQVQVPETTNVTITEVVAMADTVRLDVDAFHLLRICDLVGILHEGPLVYTFVILLIKLIGLQSEREAEPTVDRDGDELVCPEFDHLTGNCTENRVHVYDPAQILTSEIPDYLDGNRSGKI